MKDKMQIWEDMEVLAMAFKTMVSQISSLLCEFSTTQTKFYKKKLAKDKTASPKVKYCIWNQHSSGSGISFSTLAQIMTTETLHNCGFSMSGTHIISFIFLYFESKVFWIIESLRFGPSSRRLRVRSLLWLDLLHFACTRESLNLRWQSTKVWNSEIESGMRKMNGYSAALCSLGLSSGGKEP